MLLFYLEMVHKMRYAAKSWQLSPFNLQFFRVPIERVQLTSCCMDFQRSHEGSISLIIYTEARRFIFLQGLGNRGTRERDRFNLNFCWPKLAMNHLLYHDILLPI